MVDRDQLADYCAQVLAVAGQQDYCPNGLQVAGKRHISKIVSGVSACQALIDAAVAAGADALLVHHGYFWKGEDPCLVGPKQRRLQRLLQHDLNLFAYHLPLDVHREFGNNAQLARVLDLSVEVAVGPAATPELILQGRLPAPMAAPALVQYVGDRLGRSPLLITGHERPVTRIAWCTGAAQDYIELAAAAGADAYLSGEISERTFHAARELGIHYLAAGHHATERYGVQALAEHLAQHFGLEHCFIDIDNPV